MNTFNKDVDQDSAFHDHKLPGNLDYLRDIKIEAPQFLIKAILPAPSFSAIVGPSYSYKTFIALDMAFSVAAGIPYQRLVRKQINRLHEPSLYTFEGTNKFA